MTTVATSYTVAVYSERDGVDRRRTNGRSELFDESQFVPARDGSWIMLDWIEWADGAWTWYATECI